MECLQISEDECDELMITEKACTVCMIKKVYLILRGKNDIPPSK